MALTNLFGSAPPVFGSNLLFTSAIKSHPLNNYRIYYYPRTLYIQRDIDKSNNIPRLKNSECFLYVTRVVSSHQRETENGNINWGRSKWGLQWEVKRVRKHANSTNGDKSMFTGSKPVFHATSSKATVFQLKSSKYAPYLKNFIWHLHLTCHKLSPKDHLRWDQERRLY